MSRKHYIYLIIPDLHFSNECKHYINIITQVLRMLSKDDRFRGMVQLGDALDMYDISFYDKCPSRKETILDEIERYKRQLNEWARIMPTGSIFHQIEGNHSERLRRYIKKNAKELHNVMPSIPELLGFPERNKVGRIKFIWHDYHKWDSCKIGDTVFTHGVLFSKNTAMRLLDSYPCNIVQGHTHRLQVVETNDKFAITLGHGSDAKKTAHIPMPNTWCQAFGIFHSVSSKGTMEVIPVKRNQAILWGDLYRAY